MPRKLLFVALFIPPTLFGQGNPTPASGASSSDWGTRTIQVKYLDPEQLRSVYSGRSFVMQVNRELKLLTVTGPTQFLNEVEQTGKRLDVPPLLPANIEVTVYLLATSAQAPLSQNLPVELQSVAKTLDTSSGAQPLRLADSETLRVREAQSGELSFGESGSSGVSLTRISLQSAYLNPGTKGDPVSLNGLHCWMSKSSGQAVPGSDISANIDVAQNEAALVARVGVDKPLAIIVRAKVSH